MVASFVAESDAILISQISFTVFGEVVTHNLKPKGDRIPVTKENRQGIKWLLSKLLASLSPVLGEFITVQDKLFPNKFVFWAMGFLTNVDLHVEQKLQRTASGIHGLSFQ